MVSLGPKKDGGPNAEFFQSPESMQGFEAIRQWLQKNCKKVSVGRPFMSAFMKTQKSFRPQYIRPLIINHKAIEYECIASSSQLLCIANA